MGLNEDQVLSRVAVEQLLQGLSAADRCMLLLIYQIELPVDWGHRPITYTAIGEYVGLRFEGRALAEATVRYRRDEIMKMLRGERGRLRRPQADKRAAKGAKAKTPKPKAPKRPTED